MTDALNPDAITKRYDAAHLGGDMRRSWQDVPGMVAAVRDRDPAIERLPGDLADYVLAFAAEKTTHESRDAEKDAAEAKPAAVLKACDDADAHDPGHGHWISTRVIREAAQNG